MERNENERAVNSQFAAVGGNSAAVSNVSQVPNKPANAQGGGSRLWLLVSGLVVVALIVVIALLATHKNTPTSTVFNENSSIKTNEYQALFLTNGQVYFGKLNDLNHQYVTISDIYYLQVQQSLQDGKNAAQSTGSSVSLAKLGSELHGPEDKMYVAKDQVLFWENLKSGSSVVKAINKYQSSK